MHPILLRLGPITITSFGAMVATAVGVGIWLAVARLEEEGASADRSFRTLAISVLVGFATARVWAVAEAVSRDPSRSWSDLPGSLLTGGLTWYGGLIGGLIALILMSRRSGLAVRTVLDAIAPALAVGHGIGRIGCFLVGDDYGRPTDSWVGVAFPEGLPPTLDPVHPTQLYEMVWLFLVGGWLWRRRNASPFLFGEYLVLAGAGRWGVEWFRTNPDFLGPFTNAQVLAMTAMVIGSWAWLRAWRRSASGRGAGSAGT
jgi:phosphatidylglycerol:prolipoprotein diacylglycerol transferase